MSKTRIDGSQPDIPSPEEMEDEWINAWAAVGRTNGHGVVPCTREELMSLVETPLREACGILYDKNIRTYTSSCNLIDLMDRGGKATIGIDWESLSEENRAIAEQIPDIEILTISDSETGPKVLILCFPISRYETPPEVGQRATEIAGRFVLQPMTWAQKWTIEEAKVQIKVEDVDITAFDEKELIKLLSEYGMFVDGDMNIWISEEHYRKTSESRA